jgi:predicted nucleic acid-binding protein
MTAPVFVDTNVLIHAVDSADPVKHGAARRWREELWKHRLGRTSFQVLHEFYVQVTQKSPAARRQAQEEVRDLLFWQPVALNQEVLEGAWEVQDRYHLSFWDSLIVSAAKAASCAYLLTEDLQTNQNLDGLVVINPFKTDPASLA